MIGYVVAIPKNGKIYKRVYDGVEKAKASRYYVQDAVVLPTEPRHVIQYARFAYELVRVNPRYVTCPADFVSYIKGPNWNDPNLEYAHEEGYVALYGVELKDEMNAIRALPMGKAVDRMRKLVMSVGIVPDGSES